MSGTAKENFPHKNVKKDVGGEGKEREERVKKGKERKNRGGRGA